MFSSSYESEAPKDSNDARMSQARAAAIARNFSKVRAASKPHGKCPMLHDDEELAKQFSKDKKHIAQGKKPLNPNDVNVEFSIRLTQ